MAVMAVMAAVRRAVPVMLMGAAAVAVIMGMSVFASHQGIENPFDEMTKQCLHLRNDSGYLQHAESI